MGKLPIPNIDVPTNDLWSISVNRKRPLSKSFSKSTSSMSTSLQTLSNATSTTSLSMPMSISGQKRFQRYFSHAPAEEYVLKYYSCALIADILLQGHLYITPNYFGFYSNVFGYVTKILVPAASVLDIKKQKTVKIIPNAISIATEEANYVFCSLFSRDSTFKLMKEVWETVKQQTPGSQISTSEENKFPNPETSSINDSEMSFEGDQLSLSQSEIDNVSKPDAGCANTDQLFISDPTSVAPKKMKSAARPLEMWSKFRSHVIIGILVGLLAGLYLSAAVMMIRIDRLQTKYFNYPSDLTESSIKHRLSQHLRSNLDQIAKVRQDLQKLSKKFITITEQDSEIMKGPKSFPNFEDTLR